MRAIKANYVMLAMLLLAVMAFGIGPVFFRDRIISNVSQRSLVYLDTDLQLGLIDPPLLWQVQLVDARMTGRDDRDIEGRAIWRTLFGIPVGIVDDTGMERDYDGVNWRKMGRVWLAFLFVEAAMGVYCVWWVQTYWW